MLGKDIKRVWKYHSKAVSALEFGAIELLPAHHLNGGSCCTMMDGRYYSSVEVISHLK